MKATLLAIAFGSLLTCGSLQALTVKQQQELMEHGRISVYDEKTGKKAGHFEVKFLGGNDRIKENGDKAWDAAGALMGDLLKRQDFWRAKFIGSFNDGVAMMKTGVADGVNKIGDDYRQTVEANTVATDGEQPSTLTKAKNWLNFGWSASKKLMKTAWGVSAGGIYALTMPTGQLLYRPVAAGTKAVVQGTLWPIARFTFDGVMWTLAKDKELDENSMLITFVPEEIADHEKAENPRASEKAQKSAS